MASCPHGCAPPSWQSRDSSRRSRGSKRSGTGGSKKTRADKTFEEQDPEKVPYHARKRQAPRGTLYQQKAAAAIADELEEEIS